MLYCITNQLEQDAVIYFVIKAYFVSESLKISIVVDVCSMVEDGINFEFLLSNLDLEGLQKVVHVCVKTFKLQLASLELLLVAV